MHTEYFYNFILPKFFILGESNGKSLLKQSLLNPNVKIAQCVLTNLGLRITKWRNEFIAYQFLKNVLLYSFYLNFWVSWSFTWLKMTNKVPTEIQPDGRLLANHLVLRTVFKCNFTGHQHGWFHANFVVVSVSHHERIWFFWVSLIRRRRLKGVIVL